MKLRATIKRYGKEEGVTFLVNCPDSDYTDALERDLLGSGDLYTMEFEELVEPAKEPVVLEDSRVAELVAWFRFDGLEPYLQDVVRPYMELAMRLVKTQEDTAELERALDRLLESKDWAIRAARA